MSRRAALGLLLAVSVALLPGGALAEPPAAQKKTTVDTFVKVTVVSDPSKVPPLPPGSLPGAPDSKAKPAPVPGQEPGQPQKGPSRTGPPPREPQQPGPGGHPGTDDLKRELRQEARGQRREEGEAKGPREHETRRERARERQTSPDRHR